MVELLSTAQNRSLRAPCMDEPEGKRQLALEELLANRVQAIAA